ncbi:hypothetical protein GWI33_023390 [Rhynchophorus ferrugineus]|uniref:Uncharacterized protein n=1 Tax=Rhynchophorus ferrugineus TaxID=354439 RepID=A0A834M421_RHYFE|nr:hypothetical protein GWI33_023390 [Rhynchophorus ferrugineus]
MSDSGSLRLWGALASLPAKNPDDLVVDEANVSPLEASPPFPFTTPQVLSADIFSFFKSLKYAPPVVSVTASTTEFGNDVWYPVVFHNNSSAFFDVPEEMVLYSVSNASGNSSFGYGEGLATMNSTIELVTMIVTAILLGLIILATVIGKLFY